MVLLAVIKKAKDATATPNSNKKLDILEIIVNKDCKEKKIDNK